MSGQCIFSSMITWFKDCLPGQKDVAGNPAAEPTVEYFSVVFPGIMILFVSSRFFEFKVIKVRHIRIEMKAHAPPLFFYRGEGT